jgi:hypothetical protein
MEPESSLPYSQVPATCPYPEPAPSSPQCYILVWNLFYTKTLKHLKRLLHVSIASCLSSSGSSCCSLLKSRIKIVHISLFVSDVATYLIFAYALFRCRECPVLEIFKMAGYFPVSSRTPLKHWYLLYITRLKTPHPSQRTSSWPLLSEPDLTTKTCGVHNNIRCCCERGRNKRWWLRKRSESLPVWNRENSTSALTNVTRNKPPN